jgi:RHS repeat-associated protein
LPIRPLQIFSMQTKPLLTATNNKTKELYSFFTLCFLLSLSFTGQAQTRNYVRTWEATAPEPNPNNLQTRPLKDVKQTTQYFDGLGRPEQTVVKGASLSSFGNFDIVTPVEYDQYGREVNKYLPYKASNADGLYKTGAVSAQSSFYGGTGVGSPVEGQGENTFYSKSEFEASPLNRVMKQMAPGASWAGASGGGRGVSMEYLVNTANDAVRIWTVTNASNDFGSYASSTAYTAGVLYKNIAIDEHGKRVVEFKDKEGKVILKKVQIGSNPSDGHSDWLCTYYIYDDLNQLRAVIQPKAVEAMRSANDWTLSTDMLSELTFRYEYDNRGRMTMKKVPGAGAVYMVYDARDRLVMTQDANLSAQGKWMVTVYESNLNRPVQTGLLAVSGTHASHLAAAYNSTSYPSTSSGFELLTQIGYDDYTAIPSASGLDANLYPWHNDYFITSYNVAPHYAQPVQKSNLTKGLVTWTATKVLGTSQYLYTVNFYDDKGRVLQVKSKNITGATDITTTQYNFSGQPIQTAITHNTPSQGYVVRTHFDYDDLGRLVYSDKNINEQGWTPVLSIEYDALGQMKTKKLAPAFNGGIGLETLTYDYNIRGWMLGVNRAELSANNGSAKKFAFELGYDKLTNTSGRNYTAPQYNGNITGMVWESAGDGVRRKYDYSYDNANRLMQGLFEQDNAGNAWAKDQLNFDVKMGDGTMVSTAYDANGNIKGMQQWGLKGLAITQIDNLSYSYQVNGGGTDLTNKLQRVTDGGDNSGTAKLGDFKDGTIGGDDYSYDANGNLVLDNNKAISSIVYNHLNLPQTINVTGKGTIEYSYDAAGKKLKKTTTDNTVSPAKVTTTLYLFGTYENDILQFLSMEEGRLRPLRNSSNQLTGFAYDYFLKDHLGNVRMVLTDEQKTDQYPAATVEDSRYGTEDDIYDIQNGRRIDKSATGATQSSFEDKLYRVHGGMTGEKTGLGAVVKVMAGDQVKLFAESYYSLASGYAGQYLNMALSDLLSTLTGSGVVTGLKGGITSSAVEALPGNTTNLQSFLTRTPAGNQAKAYLNWVLFDEQLKYVSSGADPVIAGGGYKLHDVFINAPVTVTKNGFLYVFVSNESNLPVYFDNLAITHVRGPIVEETHYYPFGLIQQGISSKAAGTIENKKKYQQYELNTDFDINIGESFYRSHDPQLGRWWQIDPKPNVFESPYAAMGNNPILNMDVLGDTVRSNDQSYDKTILNNISSGLKLKKGQLNPISIDGETGVLSLDKKAYKKLNSGQKAVLEPLVGLMNDKQEFGLNVVSKETAMDKLPAGVKEIEADLGYEKKKMTSFTLEFKGGGNTRLDKDGTVQIYVQSEASKHTVTSWNGKAVSDPNYVIQYHEVGHAYYRYVLGVPYQGCKAIDVENDVRRNAGLPQRGYPSKEQDPIHAMQ